MKTQWILSSAALLALAMGCGKPASSADPAGKPDDEKVEEGEKEAEAPGDPVTTPDKALGVVRDVITSAAALSGGLASTNAAALTLLEGDADKTPNDPACNDGTPKNADDAVFASGGGFAGEVNERAPYYASAKWYCTMKYTIPKAFDMLVGMSCAVGDLKYDGTEVDLDKTVTVSTACYSQSFVDAAAAESISTLTVKITAKALTGSKYDKELNIKVPAGVIGENEESFNFRFSITDKHVAFVTWQTKGGAQGNATAAMLDTESGVLRYEERENNWDADALVNNSSTRHTRVKITGALGADHKLTAVTDLQGAVSSIYYHEGNGTNIPTNYSSTFVTMNGNFKDGVKTQDLNGGGTLGVNPVLADLDNLDTHEWPDGVQANPIDVPERNACFGDDGVTCAGIVGLKPLADTDFAFYLFPKGSFPATPGDVDFVDWAKSDASFLDFAAVTLTL